MDVVHDDRHPGACRGEAAEHAGLAAVGVHDIGTRPDEKLLEPAQCEQVFEGVDWPYEFRDAFKGDVGGFCGGF